MEEMHILDLSFQDRFLFPNHTKSSSVRTVCVCVVGVRGVKEVRKNKEGSYHSVFAVVKFSEQFVSYSQHFEQRALKGSSC